MIVPKFTKKVAEKCPHCGALSYFNRESIWPPEPTKPPPLIGQNNTANESHYKNQIKQIFIEVGRCLGCTKIKVDLFKEGLEKPKNLLWPFHSRTIKTDLQPNPVPSNVLKDFDEASVIESLSPTASATLSRRCMQFILESEFKEQINSATKLKKQVAHIIKSGVLPSYIAKELNGIRSVGNNAAHTNFDPANNEIIDVEPTEAAACLDVLEHLIDFVYLQPAIANHRKIQREKKHGSDER